MDDYDKVLKAAYKVCKPCANCGKKPEIRMVNFMENFGEWFFIKCSCGMQTVSDTLENNLKRWNKRK